jgi:hypothetical protein
MIALVPAGITYQEAMDDKGFSTVLMFWIPAIPAGMTPLPNANSTLLIGFSTLKQTLSISPATQA